MALVGAALGAVLVFLLTRLAPLRPSPLVQLGQLDARARGLLTTPHASHHAAASAAGPTGSLETRLGRRLTRELAARGFVHASLRQDLALTGRDLDEVMGRKVVAATAGLLLALVVLSAGQLILHVSVPLGAPLPLAALVAAGFFFLPDLEARKQAGLRRADFRRALGAYLDLVALEMACLSAPAQALTRAAQVGAGWPMALLRDTLFRATRSGRNQWAALTELGERIGVAELADLGSLIRLVEDDGARVRQTLSARAATMRRRELADAEGRAAERDVSMRLAQLVVGLGFMVFLIYPAIVNVIGL